MKKRTMLVFVGLSSILISPIANADEFKIDTDVNVENGIFTVKATNETIDFGKIDSNKNAENLNSNYNPKIKKSDFFNSISYNPGSAYWINNPYDKESPDIDFIPMNPDRAHSLATIEVFNSDMAINEWQVKLSRTPLKNSENKIIEGDHLFIGQFYDWGDHYFTGANVNDEFLSPFSEISQEKTLVASYKNKNAKGTHLISPFGKDKWGTGSFMDCDDEMTIKNITLSIPNTVKIPSAGNYSSNLIWSIEKSPTIEGIK
ncbi:hypothetical protein [Vagococcus carniphilus]|uniref:hypothetical protein n=1 Tax=Vagococcus carniphilus TaxID=218144 RepID=UPI003B59E41A